MSFLFTIHPGGAIGLMVIVIKMDSVTLVSVFFNGISTSVGYLMPEVLD